MKKKSSRFGRQNRTFNITLAAVGVILLAYIIYNSIELNKNMSAMVHARQEYQDYNRARGRLRDGSDILTESVRRFVATGDVRYRDEYFIEVHGSKNREWGINLLKQMPDEGEATNRIKQSIQEAMMQSNDLMNLEYSAMRLASTDEEFADPSYPVELKNAHVSQEDLRKDLHERKHLAMNMLFGDRYAEAKKSIYSALDDSLLGAARLSDIRREYAMERQRNLWINQIVSVALFVLLFLVFLFWAEHLFNRRMTFLQQILDNIPLMVFLKNCKTKRYVNYNQAFSDYLHQSGIEDMKGKNDGELLDQSTARELESNDEKALKKAEPSIFIERVPSPSGQARYFRTAKLGIKDLNGKSCLLGMAMDMTEEHENQMNNEATEEALMSLQQEPLLATPVKILEIIRR